MIKRLKKMSNKTIYEQEFYKILGRRISHARAKKGLTRDNVYERTGIDRSTLWSWEKGISGITLYRFAKLCALLDISIDDLLRGKEV